MAYASLHVEMVSNSKVLVQRLLLVIELSLQTYQIRLIEILTDSYNKVVIHKIAEFYETAILGPLVQVASLSMNDLKAIFQKSINFKSQSTQASQKIRPHSIPP